MSHKYGTRSKKESNHAELSENEDYESETENMGYETDKDSDIDSKGNIVDLIDYSSEEENIRKLVKGVLFGDINSDIPNYNSDSDSDYNDMDIDQKKKEKKIKEKYTEEEYKYYKTLSENQKNDIELQENILNNNKNTEIPLRFKILGLKINICDKNRIINQYEYFQTLDCEDADYFKLYRWFEEFNSLPLGNYSDFNLDNKNIKNYLVKTYNILDNCIYGHEDAKIQILQYISKMTSNPNGKANILALEGPMGNGKTTLIKDGVCKAMNRPFAFIPLGGQSDASYLVGDSMSIIGSKQGIITETLSRLGIMNPIIYFDELDKISDSDKGKELVNVLIHITDKSQNNIFRDRYFNMFDIDLSKTMFIFSFNDINKIDPILRDRLFVVKTSGFKINDKIHIAKDYLLKNIYEDIGLKRNIVNIDESVIRYIIERYNNNEEGVRTLKKCLEDICSKLNLLYLISEKGVEQDTKNIKFISDITKNIDIEEICTFFKKHKNITFPYNLEKGFCDLVLSKPGNINSLMMYT